MNKNTPRVGEVVTFTMFGADATGLRCFASSLAQQASEIEATRHALSVRLSSLSWSGPDHQRFFENWNRAHNPALVSLVTVISDSARRISAHAAAQDDVSRRR